MPKLVILSYASNLCGHLGLGLMDYTSAQRIKDAGYSGEPTFNPHESYALTTLLPPQISRPCSPSSPPLLLLLALLRLHPLLSPTDLLVLPHLLASMVYFLEPLPRVYH
jgi:hypothetical protein